MVSTSTYPPKRTLSAYHFNVAINLGLIVCSSFVLSTLMVRNYWKTPFCDLLRYAAVLVVFVFLGWMLSYQARQPDAPEWEPSPNRNDSAVLLPVACFLDPDFHIFENLTDARLDQIGHPVGPSTLPEFRLFILTTIWFGVGLLKSILHTWFDRGKATKDRIYSFKVGWCILLYKIAALFSLLVTTILAWRHIIVLRQWVSHSGWIQLEPDGGNPEDNYDSLGQLAPMMALMRIPLVFLDQFAWDDGSPQDYISLETLPPSRR